MQFNKQALQQLEEDIGADAVPMIMASIYKEFLKHAVKVQAAIDKSDIKVIHAEAHTLKSTARTIGLDELADLACSTESISRDDNLGDALVLAKRLKQSTDEAIALISEHL